MIEIIFCFDKMVEWFKCCGFLWLGGEWVLEVVSLSFDWGEGEDLKK